MILFGRQAGKEKPCEASVSLRLYCFGSREDLVALLWSKI